MWFAGYNKKNVLELHIMFKKLLVFAFFTLSISANAAVLYYGLNQNQSRIYDPSTGERTFGTHTAGFGFNGNLGFEVIDGVYYGTNGSQAVMFDSTTGQSTLGQGVLGFSIGGCCSLTDVVVDGGLYYGTAGGPQARIHDPATGINTAANPTSNAFGLNLTNGFDVIDGIYYGTNGNQAVMFDSATGQSILGQGQLGFNPNFGFEVVDGIYYSFSGTGAATQALIHDPTTGINATINSTANNFDLNLFRGFDVIDGIYYGFSNGGQAVMLDSATGQTTRGMAGPNFSPANGFAVASSISSVPIPAAAWLFGSALLGLGMLKRKK